MTKANIPRQQGDDYQARWFWLKACSLFKPHTHVQSVGWEVDEFKAFDDVVLNYDKPIPDSCGGEITAEYYQMKFHVTHNGAFNANALIDPEFIGAKDNSLLHRLRDAYVKTEKEKRQCLFVIVSPWAIDPNDALAKLVDTDSGALRLDVLYTGKTRASKMGKLRHEWCSHLGLPADCKELRRILRPLRIIQQPDTLAGLLDRLNEQFTSVGIKPIDKSALGNPYDDLIRKLHRDGKSSFTKDELIQICEKEGLWPGASTPAAKSYSLGIRSFMRWAERIEDDTDDFLCLLRHFDERRIKTPASWNKNVYPEVSAFLSDKMSKKMACELLLDAHGTIAFSAGYCLDSKSGKKVTVIQKTRGGIERWTPVAGTTHLTGRGWTSNISELTTRGHDLAVAIGVTHEIQQNVERYVNSKLTSVRRILDVSLISGPGDTVIQDGAHAFQLAQDLIALIRKSKQLPGQSGRVHIIFAAPNGFMFFLGQQARSIGRCVLHEYDFDSGEQRGYEPSLEFPVS